MAPRCAAVLSACYLGLLPCQYIHNPDLARPSIGSTVDSLDTRARAPHEVRPGKRRLGAVSRSDASVGASFHFKLNEEVATR
jgi:hypothetical protein